MDRYPTGGISVRRHGMAASSNPHISPALRHLRLIATVGASVLALCLLAQVLVGAFVHFTDISTTTLKPEPGEKPVKVVASAGGEELLPGRQRPDLGVEINTVPSRGGVLLERTADLTQTLGVLGAIVLALAMFQSVTIAGNGRVPGVEMAVTASTWATMIALLCVPWQAVFAGFAYSGVFMNFEHLREASTAIRAHAPNAPSGLSFYSTHFVFPLLMIVGLAAVVIRFRLGVEQGVIATHASQIDELLEREIRARKLGELSTPRAVGALNHAIGGMQFESQPAQPPPPPPPAARPAPPPMPFPEDPGPAQKRRPMSARLIDLTEDEEEGVGGPRRPI